MTINERFVKIVGLIQSRSRVSDIRSSVREQSNARVVSGIREIVDEVWPLSSSDKRKGEEVRELISDASFFGTMAVNRLPNHAEATEVFRHLNEAMTSLEFARQELEILRRKL